ncbi:MAG: MotA/TolQ/ExbB proton channel family protein [Muribaculaceae bacterium]|nr:MotA/TolQ/ExbB proton channel family protein [Muribaculaceae bacterium]
MTFWETIQRGEYVMIALALLLVTAVVIWWVCGLRLRRQRAGYGLLIHKVRDHVTEGDLENARQLCESSATPAARIIEAGLLKVGHPMADIRDAMKARALLEEDGLQRGLPWLRMIAVVAPLAGLGGTLVGVIDRLRDLSQLGVAADIATLSGEIAPTIVTTVAGLGVGIFALLAYSCLASSAAGAKKAMKETSLSFLSLLDEPSS